MIPWSRVLSVVGDVRRTQQREIFRKITFRSWCDARSYSTGRIYCNGYV